MEMFRLQETHLCTKTLTVFRPPLSLCIQLKRFSYKGMGLSGGGYSKHSGFGRGGGKKIIKPIEFPANLKLPLSDGRSCGYSLSGIVIHVGGSASSGHYTACVKRPGKNGAARWFHMDDSFAEPMSEKAVLRQKDAYLLFYCREEVKLEFPSPPLRGSMSAEEAKELGRARARARSDSLAEARSTLPVAALARERIESSDSDDAVLDSSNTQSINDIVVCGEKHPPKANILSKKDKSAFSNQESQKEGYPSQRKRNSANNF
jgi:hypothetical protein